MEKKILRAGLVGLGGMGRGHLGNYLKFNAEGDIIELVAVCDIDPSKFEKADLKFNLESEKNDADCSAFRRYTSMDDMLANEDLDMVTIALPTYLHCEATIKFLDAGVNVLCEKPMGMNLAECDAMIEAARRNGRQLMIGQCLRFWEEYRQLKQIVDEGTYGKPLSGFFYRGGQTPRWTVDGTENWYLKKECGGGAVFDQHVHDVDMVQYLYGMPQAVSSVGMIVHPGCNFETVTTNYIYADGKSINAQNDWNWTGSPFFMGYRANFAEGSVRWENGEYIKAGPGEKMTPYELEKSNAYYNETRYFAECIRDGKENTINPPEASRDTIRLVLAEIASCEQNGRPVEL